MEVATTAADAIVRFKLKPFVVIVVVVVDFIFKI